MSFRGKKCFLNWFVKNKYLQCSIVHINFELITMFNQYNGYGGGKPNIAQEFNSLKASALRAGSEALRIKVNDLRAGSEALRIKEDALEAGSYAWKIKVDALRAGPEALRIKVDALRAGSDAKKSRYMLLEQDQMFLESR